MWLLVGTDQQWNCVTRQGQVLGDDKVDVYDAGGEHLSGELDAGHGGIEGSKEGQK